MYKVLLHLFLNIDDLVFQQNFFTFYIRYLVILQLKFIVSMKHMS